MVLILICLGVTLAACLWSLRLYYELWKWARECQYWHIAIEYKGRVKLNASLQEWLLWGRAGLKDPNSGGTIPYHMGGTRVGIVTRGKAKANFDFKQFRREIYIWLGKRRPKLPAREGKWTAKDDTPPENKAATVHKIRG